MRSKASTRFSGLAVALTLAGCTVLPSKLLQANPDSNVGAVTGGQPPRSNGGIVSNNAGSLISNNAGSLISNNAAGLTGSVSAPASLISNNAGSYRTLALAQVPLQRALVYLSDTQERNYLDPDSGQVIATTTDDQGRFTFAHAPANESVVVDAVLSGNRRMVGFSITRPGDNRLALSLSSTLVTEFLRSRALAAGNRTLGSYDPNLQVVPQLNALTQQALDAGQLAVPDLTVGRIPDMNRQYLVGFATKVKALKQAWQGLLGEDLTVIETLAGRQSGFAGDGGPATEARLENPNGCYRAADGTLFIADAGNNRIRKVTPQGIITTVAGGGFLGSRDATDVLGDGGPATQAILQDPRGVVQLPNGGLLISEFTVGRLRYVAPDGTIQIAMGPNVNGSDSTDGPLLTTLPHPSVRLPATLVPGPDGAIYFADPGMLVVRKLSMAVPGNILTARVDRVAGVYGTRPDGPVVDGTPALDVPLEDPVGLCFDATGSMYISEIGGHRIMRVDPDGRLYHVAGSGSDRVSGDGGLALNAGIPFPSALAYDAAHNRLIVGNWQTPRLRAIDLHTGIITHLLGGGTSSEDGLASDAALSDIGAMMIESTGNLLFSEIQSSRLRRLNLVDPP